MSNKFQSTFDYKLIYIFRINDSAHENLLKIGDATLNTNSSVATLVPNCKELNAAARQRIDSYTRTASIKYELLYTEIALRSETKKGQVKIKAFRDNQVHSVLMRSGIPKHNFNLENAGKEWFKTDLETAKNAIKAVKNNQSSLNPADISSDKSPIVFRPEQEEAIKATLKNFKTSDVMLWNAKMRFGKTLSALEVVKKSGYKHVLICTHRPVVKESWYEDFGKIFYDTDYKFVSNKSGERIEDFIDSDTPFICFSSMQDLRGSEAAGGKFSKNDYIFLVDWDLIIIDEAHEGTKTTLGQSVFEVAKSNEINKNTKLLSLSGTPFNLLDEFKSNEIYTWDYVMEQDTKMKWALEHFGDSNPYEELPKMNIFTYDLNKLIDGYYDLVDSAFNFKEFFRTWTGNIEKDYKKMPSDANVGDFVHECDVKAFLDLLATKDDKSNYPFSTEEYRSFFRHTLWMVPGVKEAKALSKLMHSHIVFGSGSFNIVNVAGDGDEETDYKDALKAVQNAISDNPDETYSITISCGRLTTGVTVPEWTAVMMLAGSFSTSAANYLQTIFRVQTPANINGRTKERCYVFDFAPDRTLKMVAEAGKLSTKVGETQDRDIMGRFLNFCPVIAVNGSSMHTYDVDIMMQQLKKVAADRAVKNGFDDKHIYNDNLLTLKEEEYEEFENLKKIIGASKQTKKADSLDMNKQGMTNEEYETVKKAEKKPAKERTAEEVALLEERKNKKDNAQKAMSILRGISIRIPLLIYGANIAPDKEITCDNFVDMIDDSSWNEFMPTGVTKAEFKKFTKYYEQDVFVAAGRQIRNIVLAADELAPLERVIKIADLFRMFKNPDKETVLTPWRVVNMHMGDCLGGYNFYDEKYANVLEMPRYIDHGDVTKDTLANKDALILEINSKTGLYPLYVVYSMYQHKLNAIDEDERTFDKQHELWMKTVEKNMFIICKTEMAKQITKRTLLGYRVGKINAHKFDDLINQLKEKPEQFREKISRSSFWKLKETKEMKFNAIVGNPPYQDVGGSGGNNDAPIYQEFALMAIKLNPNYSTLIIPSRWYSGGRENLLGKFREKILNSVNLSKIIDYPNAAEVFSNVEIKGGVCCYLIDTAKQCEECDFVIVQGGVRESNIKRNFIGQKYLIRYKVQQDVVDKVRLVESNSMYLNSIVSSDTPFGISSNPKTSKKNPIIVTDKKVNTTDLELYHIERSARKIEFIDKQILKKNIKDIDKFKVFIVQSAEDGNSSGKILGVIESAGKGAVCSQSYLYVAFDNEIERNNFVKYYNTKFLRFLVSTLKTTQSATNKFYANVPVQDFTSKSDINWDESISKIDAQLYKKYKLGKDEVDFIESKIKPMV